MFPAGIEYVVPMPGTPVAPGSGWMRMSLPFGLLLLAAVRCASQNSRPGRSSIGVKPSDANGFVLSPVDRYRSPFGANASEPAEWQHSWRCAVHW